MNCRRKMIESGATQVPRQCRECGLGGICPHYPHTPKLTPEQELVETKAKLVKTQTALSQAIEFTKMRTTEDERGKWITVELPTPEGSRIKTLINDISAITYPDLTEILEGNS